MAAAPSYYVIFLRGVNVGSIKITSTALKQTMLGMEGIDSATPVLASGNVLVSTTLTAGLLKTAAEHALRDAFGYDAWVVVLPREEVAQLVEDCPYPDADKTTHTYVTVSSDRAVLDTIEREAGSLGEVTRLAPHALAWRCPAGHSTDAPIAKVFAKPRFKQTTTTRNLRTLHKVLALPHS